MRRIDLEKLNYMNDLIKRKSTGSPEQFAKKLNVSRSTFFDYLAYMRKDLQLDIKYDNLASSYYYGDGTDLSVYLKLRTPISA